MNLKFNVISGKGIKRTRLFWSLLSRLLTRLRLSFKNFIIYFISILIAVFLIFQNLDMAKQKVYVGGVIDAFESLHLKLNDALVSAFIGGSTQELQNTIEQREEEIQRLKEQNERFKDLAQENQELKKILNIFDSDENSYKTVKVLGSPHGLMWSFLDIELIKDHGLFGSDTPVLMDRAIIGRLSIIGLKSARIMLITSSHSKIPVKLKKANFNAILQGQNNLEMVLIYLKSLSENGDLLKDKIKEGDILYTSGTGGVFPEGHPIARVYKIYHSDQNHKITAIPLVDFSAHKFAQIMNGSLNVVNE